MLLSKMTEITSLPLWNLMGNRIFFLSDLFSKARGGATAKPFLSKTSLYHVSKLFNFFPKICQRNIPCPTLEGGGWVGGMQPSAHMLMLWGKFSLTGIPLFFGNCLLLNTGNVCTKPLTGERNFAETSPRLI